jgi:chromosome segregation ATPase
MDAELIAYLDRRFDQIDQKFDQIDQKFDQIDLRFDQIDQRFKHIDQRFDEIDRRIGRIDQRTEQIERRLDQHDRDIQKLFVLMEDMSERLGLVAEGVIMNTQRIDALRADMNREFEEVKAVNRLSYAELDRRWREHDRRITDLEIH